MAAGVQDDLNQTALSAARAGKRVVRLKSGDPFIYGRGGEEVLFFRAHGVEAAVVPGCTSVSPTAGRSALLFSAAGANGPHAQTRPPLRRSPRRARMLPPPSRRTHLFS